MELLLSETQTFLQQAVSGAVDRYAPLTAVREWITDGELGAADRLAADQGWSGIGIGEDIGGQGGTLQDLVVVAEQLGRGAVPWDLTFAGHLSAPLLAATGEQGRELAAATTTGERVTALCFDARVNDSSPTVNVTSGRASGTVRYVLGAAEAALLVAPLVTPDGDVELWAVRRDADAVSVTVRRLVDRTRSLADVDLQNAPVELLGTVSDTVWQQMILTAVVLNCADSLGASSRLLEMTTAYVKDRQQFGVAVGSFQAVKHSAAQMLVDVEGMRSSVQYAAWAVETGDQAAASATSVAGGFCSQAAPAVADRALFLHGAIGYTWEHDLQLLFKRVKSNAGLFGSTDWHRERVSDALGCSPA